VAQLYRKRYGCDIHTEGASPVTDAPDATRCTAKLGELRCSLEHDHEYGCVFVSAWKNDRHGEVN